MRMPLSKRDLVAECARYSGVTSLLGMLPAKAQLLVLDYHRIGDANACPYDTEVFSATRDELDAQVRFLKRRYRFITLDEAVEMVEKGKRSRSATVLLTFDDGYVDNYEIAFPVLSAHGVQGVFFLPTAFIGTNHIPWWDTIAFIVKNSRKKVFQIGVRKVDLGAEGVPRAVRSVLRLYKSCADGDSGRFIAMLEEACDSARPAGGQRCFMGWEEAAALVRGGMAVGSHTHRHEILSKLPEAEQLEELVVSRKILEERLGLVVDTVAYPVGLPDSFSLATQAMAEKAGYRAAFSYYGGFNIPGATPRYDVRRVGIASPTSARFRLQTTLALATGKYWF